MDEAIEKIEKYLKSQGWKEGAFRLTDETYCVYSYDKIGDMIIVEFIEHEPGNIGINVLRQDSKLTNELFNQL